MKQLVDQQADLELDSKGNTSSPPQLTSKKKPIKHSNKPSLKNPKLWPQCEIVRSSSFHFQEIHIPQSRLSIQQQSDPIAAKENSFDGE